MNPRAQRYASTIGARIREKRKAEGISLKKLCLLSGISYASLQNLEAGKRDPHLSTIVLVSDALKIDIQSLFAPSEKRVEQHSTLDPRAPISNTFDDDVEGYDLDD